MKDKFERPSPNEVELPGFENLPYPLTPPENVAETPHEVSDEEAALILEDLLLDLREIIEKWKISAQEERAKLAEPRPLHDLPLEYRAGMSEGLERASRDLEQILESVRH